MQMLHPDLEPNKENLVAQQICVGEDIRLIHTGAILHIVVSWSHTLLN